MILVSEFDFILAMLGLEQDNLKLFLYKKTVVVVSELCKLCYLFHEKSYTLNS